MDEAKLKPETTEARTTRTETTKADTETEMANHVERSDTQVTADLGSSDDATTPLEVPDPPSPDPGVTDPSTNPQADTGQKVAPQITDAVTQSNVKVLGEAPAEAMAMVYQMMAQAVGLSMQNAVLAQQQMNNLSVATTARSINLILNGESTAAAEGVQELLNDGRMTQDLEGLAATLAGLQQTFQPREK